MPLVKEKGVRIPITFSEEVAGLLRAVVKRDRLSQSTFVQNAVIRAIRNHRSPEEFINEGRGKKGRENTPGGLDLDKDRPDGVPKTHATNWPEKGWREFYGLVRDPRPDLDKMRAETGREPLTDAEWKAVVKHMGYEPGTRKSKGVQWGDSPGEAV